MQPQINEEGGVSAEVAPTGFELSNPQFKITFTAHQGDLNFDLTKNAVLIDDKNNQYKPISWTGGSGGHHLAGQLIFPAIAKNIKITIDNDAKSYEVNNFLKKTINLFLFFMEFAGARKRLLWRKQHPYKLENVRMFLLLFAALLSLTNSFGLLY